MKERTIRLITSRYKELFQIIDALFKSLYLTMMDAKKWTGKA